MLQSLPRLAVASTASGVVSIGFVWFLWPYRDRLGGRFFVATIGVASFLLAETVCSYGRLYRTQAAAIAISPIFPGLPFPLWLAEVGATPPLNLTALFFPIHLAFDVYAFFSRDMFDMVPAARRIADRAAIDTLGTPVAIVDAGGRLIEHNDDAARVLGFPAGAALEHGSGLGLWIVKWGVASLGGTIEFDTADTGTTARVTLPVAGSDADAAQPVDGTHAPTHGDNP